MEVIENSRISLGKFCSPVVTIGNFDGVHRGHQALIKKVREKASELGGESIIITFHPHPVEVLFPGKKLHFITPYRQKLELFEMYGVDYVWVIPFSKMFAEIGARDFIREYLVGMLGIRWIVVGYDYHFGKGREGNFELLKGQGRIYGFGVESVSEVMIGGIVVSSTSIRKLIQEGQVRTVANLLGRPYEIRGRVVRGRDRGGRLLGFPTANVDIGDYVPPKTGVYAVEVVVDGITYKAAANYGLNPTFGDTRPTLEVHIIDFDKYIYNKLITVRFISYIRGERKFPTVDDLINQIKRDVEAVRSILS
ncbi:MAG: bifunctional riboflavin kinase/FAD synthetase [Deltaproteobacteria bacterium]|nr:bifunctional riboflavin kinase/FAD synthetase [Deltaproteobacteria bacterium]MBW2067692.1 bifunctional riboflavin kinase/FAD synthetase [Deltaproteobacteria bacterium]